MRKNPSSSFDLVLPVCIALFVLFAAGCATSRVTRSSVSERQERQSATKDEAQQHINKGDELLREGDLESAITEYTKAIRIHSGLMRAFMHRGVAYARLKRFDEAVADFTWLIKKGLADVPMAGAGPDVYYSRGSVYLDMEDYEKAISDFSRGIEVASELYEAQKQRKSMIDFSPMLKRSLLRLHHIRAKVYTLKKEYNKALQDYSEAIGLFPEEPVLYRDRAELLETMGDDSKALNDLEKYERLMQKLKEHSDNT